MLRKDGQLHSSTGNQYTCKASFLGGKYFCSRGSSSLADSAGGTDARDPNANAPNADARICEDNTNAFRPVQLAHRYATSVDNLKGTEQDLGMGGTESGEVRRHDTYPHSRSALLPTLRISDWQAELLQWVS
jgi:hypothetical protein